MYIPESCASLLKGTPRVEPVSDYELIYPPVGFLPLPVDSLGNGDESGFYWPVGRESSAPLVAVMSHDCHALIPVASSLEALAKLRGSVAAGLTDPEHDDDEEFDNEVDLDWMAKLALDPDSPHLLVATGDLAMQAGDLTTAERNYRRAIELLPEYTAAHFGLAVLYRRQRMVDLATCSMLAALRSPLCFQGASFWADTSLPFNRSDWRRKCLAWLWQIDAQQSPRAAKDPFFHLREKLTLATGEKTIADFALYDELIGLYVAEGRGAEAVCLAMLYGELMMCETVSFRERSAFTLPDYRGRLLELFRLATPRRAAFLFSVD